MRREREAAYDTAAAGHGLRRLDERVLRFVDAVGICRTVPCLAQLPMLAEALEPALQRWRATLFASGLRG